MHCLNYYYSKITNVSVAEADPNIILKCKTGTGEIVLLGEGPSLKKNCPHRLAFRIKNCKKNLSTISIIYPHPLFYHL